VLLLTQHRCTVCAERTIRLEIIFDAPDGTARDVGHVESRFGSFGDGVSVGARLVHGLRSTYHRLGNHFGRTRWNSYVTFSPDESHFGPFGYNFSVGAR
jgi:hypothetical protein